jgi:hypothetical protein
MKKLISASVIMLLLSTFISAQTKKQQDKWFNLPEPSLKSDTNYLQEKRSADDGEDLSDTLYYKKLPPSFKFPSIISDNKPVNRFYAQTFKPKDSRFIIKPDTSVKYYLIIKVPPEMGSYK